MRCCGRSATSSASWRASHCAPPDRAISRDCVTRSALLPELQRVLVGHRFATARAAGPRIGCAPGRARAARRRPSSPTPPALLRDGGVIAAGLRRRPRRTAPHQRAQRRGAARARGARARAHRLRQPALRLQPRAGLLHRGQPQPGRPGAGRLGAPPDGEECRALHHTGAEVVRGQSAGRPRPVAGPRARTVRGAARPAHRVAARTAGHGSGRGRARRARRRWRSAPSRCGSPGRNCSTNRASTSAAAGTWSSSSISTVRSCRTTCRCTMSGAC